MIKGASWIPLELKRLYGNAFSREGVDLNGDGLLQQNERIATFNNNAIPGNDRTRIGDWTDWLALYRANHAAISRKARALRNSIFHWSAKFKSDNPIHTITSIESRIVSRSDILHSYKKVWNVISLARHAPIKATSLNIKAQEKLTAVYTAMRLSGMKIERQKNPLFADNVRRNSLDCDTSSFIALIGAHEQGWPVHLVFMPNHVFVRWDNKKRGNEKIRFNADFGKVKPDSFYTKRIAPQTISQKVYFNNLDEAGVAAAALFNVGLELAGKGRHRSAIDCYTEAIRLHPKAVGAIADRGLSYTKLRLYQRAMRDFNRAISLDPRDALSFKNRGGLNVVMKKYHDAIKDFTRALELNRELVGAFYGRGLAYSKLRRYHEAIRDLTKAIQLNPKHAGAFHDRGVAYGKMGKYHQAIRDLNRAIELKPKDAIAYNDRGVTYFEMGEYEKARKDLKRALHYDPKLKELRPILLWMKLSPRLRMDLQSHYRVAGRDVVGARTAVGFSVNLFSRSAFVLGALVESGYGGGSAHHMIDVLAGLTFSGRFSRSSITVETAAGYNFLVSGDDEKAPAGRGGVFRYGLRYAFDLKWIALSTFLYAQHEMLDPKRFSIMQGIGIAWDMKRSIIRVTHK